MTDPRRLLQAALRQSLSSFIAKAFATLEPGASYLPNWHVDAMAYKLEQVARGEVRRLIINVPPRHLKSICASVAFPAWLLGHDPTKKIIATSYAQDLARTHALAFRTLVEEPWYQELFPGLVMQRRRRRDIEMVTTRNGYRFASGLGGSILGRGADVLIADDAIKPSEALSEAERRRVNETFDNTLYTRLNDKRAGAIIIIMQRLHQDDLVGHVLARGDWDVLSLPAVAEEETRYRTGPLDHHIYIRRAGELLHPAREDHAVLDEVRRNLGSASFSAQYQQQPIPQEGAVIKRAWIRTYTARPAAFEQVIASWDTASTLGEGADYSAGTVWGLHGTDFYLLDVVRERLETPELRRRIVEVARQHRVDATIVEDSDIGRAVVQDLRRSNLLRPTTWRPHHDKLARLLAQAARFEAGQVQVPEEAPWLATYLTELLAFPQGRNDDQVDSTSQALHYLTRAVEVRQARPRPPGRARPIGRQPRPSIADALR